MSLYEVLVFVALALVGGYAFYLYRSDTRPKPPGAEGHKAEGAPARPMFERVSKGRAGDGTGPGPRH